MELLLELESLLESQDEEESESQDEDESEELLLSQLLVLSSQSPDVYDVDSLLSEFSGSLISSLSFTLMLTVGLTATPAVIFQPSVTAFAAESSIATATIAEILKNQNLDGGWKKIMLKLVENVQHQLLLTVLGQQHNEKTLLPDSARAYELSPLWARFYDLNTNKPIFVGSDGVPKSNFSEIELERRTGYLWY